MEEMLFRYILPELDSGIPFLRARACWTYGIFGSMKFTDINHVEKIIFGIFKNMHQDQPLPVKFEAARALGSILENEVGIQFIKPGLDAMLKNFLSLMNEFDSEELMEAFENVMMILSGDIKPYAIEICKQLNQYYMRRVAETKDLEDFNDIDMTLITAFNSMQRILQVVKGDVPLLAEVENTMYPCLEHSLTGEAISVT